MRQEIAFRPCNPSDVSISAGVSRKLMSTRPKHYDHSLLPYEFLSILGQRRAELCQTEQKSSSRQGG